MKKVNIEELYNFIFFLEKKYDLFELKINNIYIWEYLRPIVVHDLTYKLSIYQEASDQGKKLDMVKNFFSYLKSCFVFNPYFPLIQKDVLIFDAIFKKLVDGEWIDVHTKYYIDELKNRNISYEVYELPYKSTHVTSDLQNRRFLDFISILTRISMFFTTNKFTKDERSFCMSVQSEIENRFQTNYDFFNVLDLYLKKFKVKTFYFTKLLQIKKPKKLVVITHYGLEPLISVAKKLNIETIEIQHGFIGKFHYAYSYPEVKKNSLRYYPDKIYLWDEYWKHMCCLPLSDENIIIYGNKFLENEKHKFQHISKKKDTVLVISQGAKGESILQEVLLLAEKLINYKIFYKLHPAEYEKAKSYMNYNKIKKFSNIILIDNDNISLYSLLQESKFVLGVYSTVLFESLSFGCKVFLFKLDGIENLDYFISKKVMKVIHNFDTIKETFDRENCNT